LSGVKVEKDADEKRIAGGGAGELIGRIEHEAFVSSEPTPFSSTLSTIGESVTSCNLYTS